MLAFRRPLQFDNEFRRDGKTNLVSERRPDESFGHGCASSALAFSDVKHHVKVNGIEGCLARATHSQAEINGVSRSRACRLQHREQAFRCEVSRPKDDCAIARLSPRMRTASHEAVALVKRLC